MPRTGFACAVLEQTMPNYGNHHRNTISALLLPRRRYQHTKGFNHRVRPSSREASNCQKFFQYAKGAEFLCS